VGESGRKYSVFNPLGLCLEYYGYISLKGYCVYDIVLYPIRGMFYIIVSISPYVYEDKSLDDLLWGIWGKVIFRPRK